MCGSTRTTSIRHHLPGPHSLAHRSTPLAPDAEVADRIVVVIDPFLEDGNGFDGDCLFSFARGSAKLQYTLRL